ncbi:MAG: sulfotransferase family protein [Psychromonas sp.]
MGTFSHWCGVWSHPQRIATWRAAASGEIPDWAQIFEDYSSTVDWPAAYFWRELSEYFPNAKIILSVRDADAWYESINNTILQILRDSEDQESIGMKLIHDGVFGGNITDRQHVIDVFNKNILAVQAEFGQDRLLTYELGSGWEPLCQFLQCPIPDQPYPYGNNTADFKRKVDKTTDTPSG